MQSQSCTESCRLNEGLDTECLNQVFSEARCAIRDSRNYDNEITNRARLALVAG